MNRLQAYKFQLKTTPGLESRMRQFSGSCRFVWNKALALQQECYQADGTRIRYNDLAGLLVEWKKAPDTNFLVDVHSQILQQTLKDLEKAWVNFFQKRADRPRFKKKGKKDSFRFPQGFKLDQANSRIYLPKLGWIRYRNSRQVEGNPKQVTVSKELDRWYISVQTEREVDTPKHSAASDIGIDMGISNFAVLSNGTMIPPVQALKDYSGKLARIQRKLSRKKKGSSNWKKTKTLVSKTHQKIGRSRQDFLHKTSTYLSKNHALIFVEDLQVKNMSASAKGTVDQPGKNVKAKAGLNRSILDQGWFEFRRQLEYKQNWRGGMVVSVPPMYTSQQCPECFSISAGNRRTQSRFQCISCGYENHADLVGAINVRRAGHARLACGEMAQSGRSMNQEPAEVSQLAFS